MRIVAAFLLFFLAGFARGDELLYFNFAGSDGTQGQNDPSYIAPDFTSAGLVRPSFLTPAVSAGISGIGATGWKPGDLVAGFAADGSGFFAFNLEGDFSVLYSLESITLTLFSGTGGPQNFAIFSSLDNYTDPVTQTYVYDRSLDPVTFTFLDPSSFENLSGLISFGIYGWGGTSTSATAALFYSVTLDGSVVPEPSTGVLLIAAATGALVWGLRRRARSVVA